MLNKRTEYLEHIRSFYESNLVKVQLVLEEVVKVLASLKATEKSINFCGRK